MSRRDRPPSGRHNANVPRDRDKEMKLNPYPQSHDSPSPRPQSARLRNPSPRVDNIQEPKRMNRPMSAASARVHSQPPNKQGSNYLGNQISASSFPSPASGRLFDEAPLSSNRDMAESVVQRLRDKIEIEKRAAESENTRLLGEYNAFSRPKNSVKYPLRSSLLDPEVNNLPPSKTRRELMKKLKISAIPHPSYDIDGDGWVSQEDYKLAKRFDFDGNGVIDPDEREVAKHVIADEFFRNNADHMRVFGKQFARRSHEENIASLEKAHCFERTLRQLKSVEEGYRSRSSKEMARCMANENSEMAKCHFYNEKADTVAFTDYDAMPRSTSQFSLRWSSSSPSLEKRESAQSFSTVPPYGNTMTEHHGSRRLLMMARKEQAKLQATVRFESANAGVPKFRAQKLALISDFSIEN